MNGGNNTKCCQKILIRLICVALLTKQTFEFHRTDSDSTDGGWGQLSTEPNSLSVEPGNGDDKNDSAGANAGGGLPTLFRLTLKAQGCEFRIHARALGSAETVSGGCALRIALSVAEGADPLAPPSSIQSNFAGSLPHGCCGGYVKGYFAHAGDGVSVRTAVDLMSPRAHGFAPPRPADCNHRSAATAPLLLVCCPQRIARRCSRLPRQVG